MGIFFLAMPPYLLGLRKARKEQEYVFNDNALRASLAESGRRCNYQSVFVRDTVFRPA